MVVKSTCEEFTVIYPSKKVRHFLFDKHTKQISHLYLGCSSFIIDNILYVYTRVW